MRPSNGLVEGVEWWEVARGERAEAGFQGREENVRGLQLQRRERPAFGDISKCKKTYTAKQGIKLQMEPHKHFG